MIPEHVHAAAFLGYTLAAALAGFALAAFTAAQPGEDDIRRACSTPGAITGTTCHADLPTALPAPTLLLAAAALAVAGVAFAFHTRRRAARPILAAIGWAGAAFDVLLSTDAPGLPAALAAVIAAAVCTVMARLPYSAPARRYLDGHTPLYAERLTHPQRPARATRPGEMRAAAGYLVLLTIAGLWPLAAALAFAPAATLPALGMIALHAAAARGLLRGRLWARAYTTTLTSLSLAAVLPAAVQLWALAHPKREGFLTPDPADVGTPLAVLLTLAAVNAAVLYATAFSPRTSRWHTHAH
ncbi:hypothetical protein [Kitasatospora cheerisanensis]|uniref:Uncharacterized protein n=1 Tax=Kitasatospora cheerisanensis KCTC 2395 TaxID=1348663 RepID=A0A066YQV5_9ACTN|nr:hypothetical protein [Kitasatospora cheerisanensis]KDN80471.1 hypothetical protein KCH_77590 [Kitasatospora cheerisanensis KCTC 2395]